jgi:hypothetical protein
MLKKERNETFFLFIHFWLLVRALLSPHASRGSRVTRDRCYDEKKYFCRKNWRKNWQKIGIFAQTAASF